MCLKNHIRYHINIIRANNRRSQFFVKSQQVGTKFTAFNTLTAQGHIWTLATLLHEYLQKFGGNKSISIVNTLQHSAIFCLATLTKLRICHKCTLFFYKKTFILAFADQRKIRV